MDMCKRPCILVVPCILAAGLQAGASYETQNWGIPFIQIALKHNIDIHVLPCTESCFNGFENGFARRKHGIDYYSNLPGYQAFCSKKANEAAETVNSLIKDNVIIAVIGVEHSPSCAINYMYSHRGMLKESGLFMKKLRDYLIEKQISPPFIGVNRKYPKKALTELETLILFRVNERER